MIKYFKKLCFFELILFLFRAAKLLLFFQLTKRNCIYYNYLFF